jgi:mono/diheme cytochrome c family protein
MTAEPRKDAYETATAFNRRHGWGIEPAVMLALEVLEDCNAHSLAAVLLEAADREAVAP